MNKIEDCKVYSLNLKGIIIGAEEDDKTDCPNIIDFIFGWIYDIFDYMKKLLSYIKNDDDKDLIKKCVCDKPLLYSNCLSKCNQINEYSTNSQDCQECLKFNKTPKCECEQRSCSCLLLDKLNEENKPLPNICNSNNFKNCCMHRGCEAAYYIEACNDLIDKTFAKLLNPMPIHNESNKLNEICNKISFIITKTYNVMEKMSKQNNYKNIIERNTININPCEELDTESVSHKLNETKSEDSYEEEYSIIEEDAISSNNVSIASIPIEAIPLTGLQKTRSSSFTHIDNFDEENIVEPNNCNNKSNSEFIGLLSKDTKCEKIKQNDSLFIIHELTKSINYDGPMNASLIPENIVCRMEVTPNEPKEQISSDKLNNKAIQLKHVENKTVNKSIFQATNNHVQEQISFDKLNNKAIQFKNIENKTVNKSICQTINNPSRECDLNYYNDFIFNRNEGLKQNEIKVKTEKIKGCCNYN